MFTATNWIVWAFASAIFAAFTAIFAKIGIKNIDSDFATLIRTAFISLILFIFVRLTGKLQNPFAVPKVSLLFILLSAFTTGLSWVCYFRALKIGEASKVAPIDKFSIVLVVIFSVIFLGERPALKDWIGIALISLGVVFLAIKR